LSPSLKVQPNGRMKTTAFILVATFQVINLSFLSLFFPEENLWGQLAQVLWAGHRYSSCHKIKSVKAMKETQSTNGTHQECWMVMYKITSTRVYFLN